METKTLEFREKRKMFLLDTDIYRNIARMTMHEKSFGNKFIIDEMNFREKGNNCNSILSLTTTHELLVQLDEGDKSYTDG